LEWIEKFGAEFNAINPLSLKKRKRLINGVISNISVGYNHSDKLHHLHMKFRLPVLRSVKEILYVNDITNIRGKKAQKSAISPVNTGAPNTVPSELLHGGEVLSKVHPYNSKESNQFYLTLSVDYYSATLWLTPYSEYQQFLYDTICTMHNEGNSYLKIAKWMNDNNHLTPRGATFKANHAWSIHMKKRKSIERFSRTYEPVITDVGIDVC
jgi:hypothetical protein